MPYATGRPQNYADVVSQLPQEEKLPERVDEKKGLLTACECGRYLKAFRIVDTRDLPVEVTMGQKWACDPCWTSWIRHDPKHQREYRGRPFRELDWLELHGAPSDIITKQILRDQDAHAKLARHRAEIAATSSSDGRTKELLRIDNIILRKIDVVRSPIVD